MQGVDPHLPEVQTALALSALALAFVRVLEELAPESEPLAILQSKVQVELTRLRQTPESQPATDMFRLVIETLRNPNVIRQPDDRAI
jgi:hypothetical protein